MKDETLLPCPFCGGKAEFDYDDDGLNWISCSKCGISTDTAYHTDVDARETLRDVWNRRALQSGNSAQPVTVPDELIHHDKDPEVTKSYKIGFNACLAVVKSATVTVPAGYVLVPVEPTPEMCDVGHIGIDVLTGVTSDSEYYSTWGDSAAKLYRAMLAAAPTATDYWSPVSDDADPPREGWLLTHKGRDYFYRNQIDATAHMDAITSSAEFSVSVLHMEHKDVQEISDGWIPVSERMPDETQPVIVVSVGGVVQRTVYQFCDGVWTDWYEQYNEVPTDAITHWQPLPDAPKVTP